MSDDATATGPHKENDSVAVAVGMVVGTIVLWGLFFLLDEQGTSAVWILPIFASFTVAFAYLVVRYGRNKDVSGWVVGIIAVLTVLSLIGNFAFAYFLDGASGNWSIPLSHLDAILVSVGTLTTAGTGDVQPHTELARGLVTAQMALDVVVVTVVAGVVVWRLTE
jgi:hypothetical protein